MAQSTGYNGGSYTFEQQVFCLSWASSLSFNLTGDAGEIARQTKALLLSVLGDSRVQALIGVWDVVWGPGVYADSLFGEKESVNCMFIAVPKQDPTQAVVAIAGTNGSSLMDWLVEDLNVKETVPWPYGNTQQNLEISKGTAYGLDKLVHIVCADPSCEVAITAREFLGKQSYKNVTVTGHSLGGALSPCYTLYLDATRDSWDPSRAKTLSCLPTAGPSPGNQAFATYYDQIFKGRVWNSMDVVPHAFNTQTLNLVPALYVPKISSAFVTTIVESLIRVTQPRDYLSIWASTPGFPSKIYDIGDFVTGEHAAMAKDIEALAVSMEKELSQKYKNSAELLAFLIQALIQHTIGYIVYFDVGTFTQLMTEISKQTGIGKAHAVKYVGRLHEILTPFGNEPILLELGRKSRAEIDELKKGEGQILDDIFDDVQEENRGLPHENAQLVIFLVEECGLISFKS